jgi:hypothetical protein
MIGTTDRKHTQKGCTCLLSCFAEWGDKKIPSNGSNGWLPQDHGEVVETNNQP